MKNHKKRSGSQSLEDWEKELTLKYQAENLDTAKVSSERRSLSLHRCARSLTLGVLALIGSIGISLIPGLHPTLSPATAFAAEPPPVPSPTCVGCGRQALIYGHAPRCPYGPKPNTGTQSNKIPVISRPLSKSQSPGTSMALGLLGGFLSEALNPNTADDSQAAAQQAAQEAAKRAQQEAWMKAEHQRLNNMVNQQRVTRDGEDKAGMDEMAKAMGSGFDTPMPKSDLASALSDPNVVDLRGKKGIVDPNVLKQSDPKQPKLNAKPPPALRLKELDRLMADSLKQLKEDQDKLSKALDNYSGPPVAAQTYKSVHFMGILNSQEDADKAFNKHFRNFNDGLPYEKIVAFGQHGVLKELFRGGLDREAAQLSLLSPMTLEKCHSLKGAVIDDLVVHSNAATVTEVLIKRGDIKVTNLSILGGDRSLANLAGWEKLISTGKVKEITIYVNKGDPVPWVPQLKDLNMLGEINYVGRMSKSLSHHGLVNVVFFNKKPYECASDITLSPSAAIDYHLDEVYHYNGMKYKGTDKIISKQR